MADLFSLRDDDILNLTYIETGQATTKRLNLGHQGHIRAVIAFYYHRCWEEETSAIEWIESTADDFDDFRVGIYEPDSPLKPYVSSTRITARRPSVVPPSTLSTSKVQLFKKGIKRDKSHYKSFKHERYWDDWHRNFVVTAKTHDLSNVLDSTYVPMTQDDQELFAEQQIFMYSVFEEHLLTDMGKTLVRHYESTNNAQRIYEELVTHMKTSAAGAIAASGLLREITGTQMHHAKWSGTKRSFILSWNDKVCEYNSLVLLGQCLTSNMLCQIIVPTPI